MRLWFYGTQPYSERAVCATVRPDYLAGASNKTARVLLAVNFATLNVL
jgi:hypothetical protein